MQTTVTTTFIEMTNRDQFRPKPGYENKIQVREIANDPFINFMLFAGVGLPYRWSSRFRFSIEQWKVYFKNTNLRTYLGFEGNSMVGFFELIVNDNNTEIVFFGMFPEYTGAGLGGYFLSRAIECAWATGTERIWLHTCTNDNKNALTNYLARGFSVFDVKSAQENVPEQEELVEKIDLFFRDYMKTYST
jgi:GNAT superfamily N-acetyltransferase